MEILQKLNDSQYKAATAVDGAILVLAGAGSGKTRVLTNRIAYLVEEKNINPREIMAITFTNKAANEMKERLASFNCEADKMLISTIHSMCARFLRIDGATLGYGQNFTIYSEQDADRVIKRILDSMQMNRDDKDKLKKNCMRVISDAKNELVNLDKLDEFVDDDDIDIIKEVAKKYTEQLHKSNAMDFDDLLVNTYRMFATNSDILNKYQDHYRYISVDEFQDTNKVQYEIFKLLAQKYGNLFVVGDDDQSIYGWRGANVENILNFKDDYPTAQVFKLEQNYRSTKKILSVANTIISKNTDRYEKTLWTDNSDGVRTEQFSGYTEKDESNYVIQQILGLMSRGTYSFSDFAILMRVNALSRTFEQACLQYQIPNKVFGGFKFFERAEIKDILAYLRMLDNSYDNEATLRIINVPKRGIGESTCKKLSELSADNGISIIELLSDERNLESFNRGTVIKLLGFYSIYAQLLEYKKILNLVDLVKQVVSITRYRTALLEDEEEGKALNLDELVESAQEFVNDNPDSDLSTFLQSVSLYSDLDKEDGNFVTLGTVHSVKGLEFKVVFVVGLDEGLFPLSRATYSAKEMQEERRLMYVAVTRARERLYLTRARSRFLYGEHKDMLQSRFYTDVAQSLAKPVIVRYDSDGVPDNIPESIHTTVVNNNTKSDDEVNDFCVGDKVTHPSFGVGMILSIKGGVADVIFSKVGKKTLALKFAPLTLLK